MRVAIVWMVLAVPAAGTAQQKPVSDRGVVNLVPDSQGTVNLVPDEKSKPAGKPKKVEPIGTVTLQPGPKAKPVGEAKKDAPQSVTILPPTLPKKPSQSVTIIPPTPPKGSPKPGERPKPPPEREDERTRVLRAVIDQAHADAEARAQEQEQVLRAIRDAIDRGDAKRARAHIESAIAELARQANERSARHRATLERYVESKTAGGK